MKTIVLVLWALFFSVIVHASGVMTIEAPVNGFGTPVTIAISSTTSTMVPSTQTSGRQGVFIGIPSTNTGRIVGFYGNCTSTTNGISIQPLNFAPGSNSIYLPLREDACLWLITTNTGAASENINYQEVKQ